MAKARSLRTGLFADIDERCFKCDVCGERFWIKSRLDKHYLSHTQSTFSCGICKKTFSDKTELDRHSATHYQFVQYSQCPECEMPFANQAELFQHIRSIHMVSRSAHSRNTSQPKIIARTPSSDVGSPRGNSDLPKVIQCDSLSSKAKWEDFMILNKESMNQLAKNELLTLSESSYDSSGSDSKVKSILKTQKSTSVAKAKRPLIWKEPVVSPDAAKMSTQIPGPSKPAKRIYKKRAKLDSSKELSSPRKKQKSEEHADNKEDYKRSQLFVSPERNQSPILKATKSATNSPALKSVSRGEKRDERMSPMSTTVIQVGETNLVPIKKQVETALKNTAGQPILKVVTSASNLKKGLIDFSKSTTDTASAQRIIIKLPHQGGGQEQNFKVLGQIKKQTPGSPVPPETKYRNPNIGQISPSRQLQHLQMSKPDLIIFQKDGDVQKTQVKAKTPTRIELSNQVKTVQVALSSPSKRMETNQIESPLKTTSPGLPSASTPSTGASPKLGVTPITGNKVSPKKTRIFAANSARVSRCGILSISKSTETSSSFILSKGCDWRSLLPSVSLARLPDAVYQECINKGYIIIQSQKQKPSLMSFNVGKIASIENKVSPNFQPNMSVAKQSPNTPTSVRKDSNSASPPLINPVIKISPEGMSSPCKVVKSSPSQKRKPSLMSRNVGKIASIENKVSPNFQPNMSVAKQSPNTTAVSNAPTSIRKASNATSPPLVNPVIKISPEGTSSPCKVVKSSTFLPSNQNKPATVNPNIQVVKIGPQLTNSKCNQAAKLKEAPVNPASVKVVTISPELMRKLKESVLKNSPDPSSNHIRLVVPSATLNQLKASPSRGTLGKNVETFVKSSVKAKSTSFLRRSRYTKFSGKPGEKPIFQYNAEEERKRKEEVAKIKKKEKLLKKLLLKYEEKEQKKQLKYYQKKLSRFIEKNGERFKGLEERLSDIVGNSSRLMEELQNVNCANENEVFGQLLSNLGVGRLRNNDSSAEGPEDQERSAKRDMKGKELAKKSVGGFVNMATNKVQGKLASSPIKGQRKNLKEKYAVTPSPSRQSSSKNIFTSSLSNANVYCYDSPDDEERGDQASYSKLSDTSDSPKKFRQMSPQKVVRPRRRKVKPCADDPFTDLSIITGEKFLIECPCQTPGCNGLHPEFSFSGGF